MTVSNMTVTNGLVRLNHAIYCPDVPAEPYLLYVLEEARKAKESKNWAALAADIGVSESLLSKWRRGKAQPSYAATLKLLRTAGLLRERPEIRSPHQDGREELLRRGVEALERLEELDGQRGVQGE